jgi:hypothetical protein
MTPDRLGDIQRYKVNRQIHNQGIMVT